MNPTSETLEPSLRMGEMATCSQEESLKTLLGSCIGLALYDSKSKVAGLAHIVLPDSRGQQGPPGKFVDTAVPNLIERIDRIGGSKRRLRAKLAGGANMFATQTESTIGEQNRLAIVALLSELMIPITGTDCGGEQGRRMTLFAQSGRVVIEIVGQPSTEI